MARQHANEHRILSRARIGPAMVAVCALVVLLAGCSEGPASPLFKRAGPLITLRIGVHAGPGYQSSGRYAEYERLHPEIRIVQADTAAQAGPGGSGDSPGGPGGFRDSPGETGGPGAPPAVAPAESFSDARSRRRLVPGLVSELGPGG